MSSSQTSRPTLIKPPPPLPNASPIETLLQLYPLTDISPTTYTNAYPLWHPPGARGIYGGAVIAQSLSAAQATIPPDFVVHSMHCYFVLAGDSEIPVVYEVERVRDGRSFVTRTVQARQRGRCIFTTTISFMKEGSGGVVMVEHQSSMPTDVEMPPEGRGSGKGGLGDASMGGDDGTTPFESVRCGVFQGTNGKPEEKRTRQWIRARGRISDGPVAKSSQDQTNTTTTAAPQTTTNHQAHLSALAYMSDSYFIGTVARIHNLLRFSPSSHLERTLASFRGTPSERAAMRTHLERVAHEEEEEENTALQTSKESDEPKQEVGMMVSLDHSIYFHNPKRFRADEWMLTEMKSPWAGEGRGLVLQRIWARDGVLIATCMQEGLVRLKQEMGKGSKL
jgi:acyl-CoA thioesterase II